MVRRAATAHRRATAGLQAGPWHALETGGAWGTRIMMLGTERMPGPRDGGCPGQDPDGHRLQPALQQDDPPSWGVATGSHWPGKPTEAVRGKAGRLTAMAAPGRSGGLEHLGQQRVGPRPEGLHHVATSLLVP